MEYNRLSEKQINLLKVVLKKGKIKKILFGFKITYQRITVRLYKRKAKVDFEGKHYLFESPDIKIFYDNCKDTYKTRR